MSSCNHSIRVMYGIYSVVSSCIVMVSGETTFPIKITEVTVNLQKNKKLYFELITRNSDFLGLEEAKNQVFTSGT